ncbi:uncharacterized protein LOC112126789 [Cimex lectularius]|uniref:Uncharacterized protein n=1 Tax=Cimex lectularius TaxID=79782 RepID=A0A8I6TM45_CIMLE|nr:uncharacterized protein LOC112126789 [Cimex lectularius]
MDLSEPELFSSEEVRSNTSSQFYSLKNKRPPPSGNYLKNKKKKKGRPTKNNLMDEYRDQIEENFKPNEILTIEQQSKSSDMPPCFITANPFAPLAELNGENKTAEIKQPSKPVKPPPIFLKNIVNYSDFCKTVKNLVGKNGFTCKARVQDTIVYARSVDAYRTIIRYLKTQKAEYHTYQLQEDKAFRVVMRHLHYSTPPELIKEELENIGYNVRSGLYMVSIFGDVDKNHLQHHGKDHIPIESRAKHAQAAYDPTVQHHPNSPVSEPPHATNESN